MVQVPDLEAVRQRLQQRYLVLTRRALGFDVLLVVALLSVLGTVLVKLAGWSVSLTQLYGGLVIAALLVWSVLAWRVRVSPLAVLIAADHSCDLQERLSTAYEYAQHEATNLFMPGLAAAAEKAARQVEARLVFPLHLPRRLWGLPLLLLLLVGLWRLDITPFRFDDWAQEEVAEEVAREGTRLERWGKRLEQLAQQQQLDRSLVLARHMQHLGRRLQREGGEKAQASERISTLSQYLERMQQELRERALLSKTGLMIVQDVLPSGKSVKQELQDILRLLQHDVLPGEMKQVAEQGIQRLRRYMGQNPDLERLLQNLQAGNVSAARQLLQDIIGKQQMAEEMEHLERARQALQYSSRSIQRPGAGEASTSRPAGAGEFASTRMSFDFDDETMSEDMPGMEDFNLPGFGEDYGFGRHNKTRPNQRLRESEQPLSQVQVSSGEGSMRLGYIRRLPMQNEARVPIEQVVVQYQHSAEKVLSEEKIPRGYREQIKQYFLAIGMVPKGEQ
ncbi:MAG: hypothetical protein V3R80_00345 [Candidatus Tectomicrobia bacterium]